MIALIWYLLTDAVSIRWFLFDALMCIIIHQWIGKTWSYFSRKDVKYVRGLPILGLNWRLFTGSEHFSKAFENLYKQFPNDKVVGFYDFGGSPNHLIRDPELVKKIAIKDFDIFMNHRFYIDHKVDPLFGGSLSVMRDQRWKSMRSTVSPAFTGSKMRLMFSLLGEVAHTFCEQLKNELPDCRAGDCDIRDFFVRYASDTIASCAFGLTIDSMQDKDNEFFKIGLNTSDFSGFAKLLKFVLVPAFPKLAKYLNVSIFSMKDADYIRQIVKSNMEYRERNGIVRNDMIHMMMQLKKGTLTSVDDGSDEGDTGFSTVNESPMNKANVSKTSDWDDDDIVAQCFSFILGGFSTVTLTLSFVAHELAIRPVVQQKLFREIQQTAEALAGKPLTYESLQKLKYLDMVVSETMRLWPQLTASDRLVSKPYDLDIGDGKVIPLNAGDVVTLPVLGLHKDPMYFPNPDEFIPERFSDENKGNIVTGTYMPFGIGPRSCIASRFALMACKACLFHLVANYSLERCDKTQDPLQLKINSSVIEAENGFWMRVKLRE